MDQLISQIRGVIGVSGALIYHRKREESSAMFPASYEEKTINQLKHKFFEMCHNVHVETSMRVKLQRGWMVMKFTDNFGVMVLASEDLNVSTLNLVLKSITVSLDRNNGPIAPSGPVIFNQNSLRTLLEAVNLIAEHFSQLTSRFQVADRLRQCKTRILGQYPELKNFNVDHNAHVDILRGANIDLDEKLGEAFAAWLAEFRSILTAQSSSVDFNLPEITSDIHTELDQIHFYHNFQKYANR